MGAWSEQTLETCIFGFEAKEKAAGAYAVALTIKEQLATDFPKVDAIVANWLQTS